MSLTPAPFLAALALIVPLAGCSLFDEETRLSGERLPVRAATETEAAPGEVIRQPLPAVSRQQDWTQTGGSAARSGGNLAGPRTLSAAWQADAGYGGGDEAAITSAPIVAGGRVFALDAAAHVRAFDAGSGLQAWSTSLVPEGEGEGNEGFGGGLAAEGNRLFATTGFGEVLALDAGSGEILWRRRFSGPFRAAPTVDSGRVVAVSRDNVAFALDAADGSVVWRHRGVTGETGWLGGASPLVAGGGAIVPYGSGELAALDLASGRVGWTAVMTGGRRGLARSAITDLTGGPVLLGPYVVAANQSGRIAAFEGRTGRRAWTRGVGATRPPWPAGDTLFVVSDAASLLRLDGRDGETLWRVEMPAFEDPEDREGAIGYSGPVLVQGRVLLTDSRGNLHAYDGVTGKGGVVADMPAGSITGPVVAGATVYVLTDTGTLVTWR